MTRLFKDSKRISSLLYLMRPLLLIFVGILLLSLGVSYLLIALYRTAEVPRLFYYLTLQFLDQSARAALFLLIGLGVFGAGLWRLSDLVVIPLSQEQLPSDELVLGYRKSSPPRMVAVSGGAGLLILASLGEQVEQLVGIIPLQDAVEYYYRASSLFSFRNVYYVVPTPVPIPVRAELSNGQVVNLKQLDQVVHDPQYAREHVIRLFLSPTNGAEGLPSTVPVSRMALEAIQESDVIVLGPGSLFEGVLPNLLLPEISEAIRKSRAMVIYVCNLMTEPGLTTGFDVAEHIRQIKRYGSFIPDYVLVNAQRLDPEVREVYEAAHYEPVYLDLDTYEETAVLPNEQGRHKQMLVEGVVVVEADLASAMVQLTASLDDPSQSRAVRVLRHDPEKLKSAILALLKRA